jgi:hypothetical protein
LTPNHTAVETLNSVWALNNGKVLFGFVGGVDACWSPWVFRARMNIAMACPASAFFLKIQWLALSTAAFRLNEQRAVVLGNVGIE